MKTFKLLIAIFVILFSSCKTTKHVLQQQSESKETKKIDSTVKEKGMEITIEHTSEITTIKIDTTITPKPIKGKTVIDLKNQSTEKKDTSDILDSLGKKIGIVITSLNAQKNALDAAFHAQPEDVHAKLDETTKKTGDKKTTKENEKSAALHSENVNESKAKEVAKSVERKTDFWAWIKWVSIGIVILIAWLKKNYIWDWLKKILKIK